MNISIAIQTVSPKRTCCDTVQVPSFAGDTDSTNFETRLARTDF